MPRLTRSQSADKANAGNSFPEIEAANQLEECKRFINVFRVKELQKIASFLKIPANGLKQDLKERVLNALRNNVEVASAKIKEVYEEFVFEKTGYRTPCTQRRSTFGTIQVPPPQPGAQFCTPENTTSAPQAQCTAHLLDHNANDQQGKEKSKFPGVTPPSPKNPQLLMRPVVKFKKLPFFDVLDVLVHPASLLCAAKKPATFYFVLTKHQTNRIPTPNTNIQVQLRFCLVATTCEQEDRFPPSVLVKINGKSCQLPAFDKDKPFERLNRPLNITAQANLSQLTINMIQVYHAPLTRQDFCIGVFLVKKLSANDLLHSLKSKVRPADYTRNMIKEKLAEDVDGEIVTTMLKVSLNCPLGKILMLSPCRALTCCHLQCFDAKMFLDMNERKETWTCPVCYKAARFESLVIDDYFQEVLASPLLQPGDTEIQLHKDGSWSRHTSSVKIECLDETIQLADDLVQNKFVKNIGQAKPKIATKPENPNTSVSVDLTQSDSDDDLILVPPE